MPLYSLKASTAPYILAQTAVPVGIAPNGTVATNGTITLGTALPTTYSGGIWLRLPAGAVSGGLAGMYWVVMSSTTVGVVSTAFSDASTSFLPYIPASVVTATGSNAAYTQTTASDINVTNVTLPGGSVGANGTCRTTIRLSTTNSAGAKSIKTLLDGTVIGLSTSVTTVAATGYLLTWQNRGSQSSQIAPSGSDTSAVTTANSYTSINTSINKSLNIALQLATATDYVILEGLQYEIVSMS